jgi:hypothetical protein
MTMHPPELLHGRGSARERERNYFSGSVGSTWWFYVTGRSTDEVWNAYIAHCKAMLDSGVERPALICICHRADAPNAVQRRLIADFIKAEAARLGSLVGFALVLDSPLHIFALRAINWLVRKPFPETVCGSPRDAVLWLVGRGARVDILTLTEALEQQVPRRYRVAP